MKERQFSISPATASEDLNAVRRLFEDYAASLDVDLAYQGFAAELENLPGQYAGPAGALLLARGDSGAALGCVAMRLLDPPFICEVKRLYVSPAARGLGVGSALITAIVEQARSRGYREMRLDTLPTMADAQRLYRGFGFEDIEAYYDTPVENTVFLALKI